MSASEKFANKPLGSLLREQAIPASIGILVLSLYGIIDTIFVGHFVGSVAIGAITVVLPITFLISSVGMAIGVGGSSVLSRALGSDNKEKAFHTFGNQVILTLFLALVFVIVGYFCMDGVISLFGGKGDVLEPAKNYFSILLIGVPFVAWAMMSTNVIRAEGYPRVAMYIMIVPAAVNLILDPIFIVALDMGLEGAAWATTLSYILSALYALNHFRGSKSPLTINGRYCTPNLLLIKEIVGLGSITLARQGVISILAIVLNNSLFYYGGESALSIYGIINRVLMFANFPVLGITQGFVPIVGYNYGARKKERVSQIIKISILYASLISFLIFTLLMIFAPYIASAFTNEKELISSTYPALRIVFAATPLLAFSLIISALYQATGHTKPALFLALTKQGFFLIPLVFILPIYFGVVGIWMAFPIADVGAAITAIVYFKVKKISYRDPSPSVLINPDL